MRYDSYFGRSRLVQLRTNHSNLCIEVVPRGSIINRGNLRPARHAWLTSRLDRVPEKFMKPLSGLILTLSVVLLCGRMPAGADEPLKPGQMFKDCADCPEMVVIPAGSFTMGSPQAEPGHKLTEAPRHKVTIERPFAVSKFLVTFAEWDACAAGGDCVPHVDDGGWGRDHQPVIKVSWDNAQRYVKWLSKITGKTYGLLTEAKYEYAARAGTLTAYPWGDDIGNNHANCGGCGSRWDLAQTAPVGSFAPNEFGLYDMVGNVWEWVEDCLHEDYSGAPADGSAWMTGDCSRHRLRGGSWASLSDEIRSANRGRSATADRLSIISFRVGRTLDQ
jgi:formylglycine-generating enzyme required for sulfatase activity